MPGSSDYRERKCSECNNGNIFKEIIFNGEAQVIKVFHLLGACDTNQKSNRLKVQIPFEVDLKSFLPSFANASDSIYILFAAINFYSPAVTSGHYICHLFTKNCAKLCDDKTIKVTTKSTKQFLETDHFKIVCTFSFTYNEMLSRKKHLKACFTYPWKTKIKFEICGFNQFQMVVK